MSLHRAIDTSGFAGIEPPSSFGRPPRLEWLAIGALVIDGAYQRPVTPAGRANIRRIARGFDWSYFTPVVVAPAGASRFAIVDGQHRVTAAALVGLDRVPCNIIDAGQAEQARAFGAINGNVTKLTPMQLHHAAAAAGEARAMRINAVCARAGVTIAPYPLSMHEIPVGWTLCPVIIGRAIDKLGEEPVVAALAAIVGSGDGNAGLLKVPVIWGIAEVLADHGEWRDAPLLAAFQEIDLGRMLRLARAAAARTPGTTVADQLESRLVEALAAHFSKQKKGAA